MKAPRQSYTEALDLMASERPDLLDVASAYRLSPLRLVRELPDEYVGKVSEWASSVLGRPGVSEGLAPVLTYLAVGLPAFRRLINDVDLVVPLLSDVISHGRSPAELLLDDRVARLLGAFAAEGQANTYLMFSTDDIFDYINETGLNPLHHLLRTLSDRVTYDRSSGLVRYGGAILLGPLRPDDIGELAAKSPPFATLVLPRILDSVVREALAGFQPPLPVSVWATVERARGRVSVSVSAVSRVGPSPVLTERAPLARFISDADSIIRGLALKAVESARFSSELNRELGRLARERGWHMEWPLEVEVEGIKVSVAAPAPGEPIRARVVISSPTDRDKVLEGLSQMQKAGTNVNFTAVPGSAPYAHVSLGRRGRASASDVARELASFVDVLLGAKKAPARRYSPSEVVATYLVATLGGGETASKLDVPLWVAYERVVKVLEGADPLTAKIKEVGVATRVSASVSRPGLVLLGLVATGHVALGDEGELLVDGERLADVLRRLGLGQSEADSAEALIVGRLKEAVAKELAGTDLKEVAEAMTPLDFTRLHGAMMLLPLHVVAELSVTGEKLAAAAFDIVTAGGTPSDKTKLIFGEPELVRAGKPPKAYSDGSFFAADVGRFLVQVYDFGADDKHSFIVYDKNSGVGLLYRARSLRKAVVMAGASYDIALRELAGDLAAGRAELVGQGRFKVAVSGDRPVDALELYRRAEGRSLPAGQEEAESA